MGYLKFKTEMNINVRLEPWVYLVIHEQTTVTLVVIFPGTAVLLALVISSRHSLSWKLVQFQSEPQKAFIISLHCHRLLVCCRAEIVGVILHGDFSYLFNFPSNCRAIYTPFSKIFADVKRMHFLFIL